MKTKALIFDFDGLILDTETAVYEGWRRLYEGFGQDLALPTWVQCVGSDFGVYNPADELEKVVGEKLNWEELNQTRRQFVFEYLDAAKPMEGVESLLDDARSMGFGCAVASSSPRTWVAGWLEKLDLMPYFQQVTTLDDTGKVKPDPSLFLHASERLQIDPEHCVVLEDSLNGLRAAQAAGMRCIVVPCEITKDLKFEGYWKKFSNLNELKLREIR